MIAALFVHTGGPYFNQPGIDPWDKARDARNYPGPWPVIVHSDCSRWGRFAEGGPSAKEKRMVGDDGGCFWAGLVAVRKHGGVLEHPEASQAFKTFGLPIPKFNGGWTPPDRYGGRSCCVAQGHYGHASQKMTWLYAVGTDYPELKWGRFRGGVRLDEGFHSKEERDMARAKGIKPRKRTSALTNKLTPAPFRDLLVSIASTARMDKHKDD